MRKYSSSRVDSPSRCSTASPGRDTPGCDQQSDSLSSVDSTEDMESSGTDSVVPIAKAFSSSRTPRRSTSASHTTSSRARAKPHGATQSSSTAGASKAKCSKKGQKEKLSKEEEDRRRIRRERNKIAAAKCRNRRRELIDTLQAETDQLEEEKSSLQTEIADLLKEKEKLEQVLASHKSSCKLSDNNSSDNESEDESEDDSDAMLQDPPSSPHLMSMLDNVKNPDSNVDNVSCNPAAAILGNSNIFLCSSVEEEALKVLRGDDLDDLVPCLEMEDMTETTAAVPDIDLGTPFCLSDWETLYKSVASDLDCLSTPVMSSSPTCSNYRSVFTFNYSEIDSFTKGCDSLKGKDSLNSPTLLAL